MEKDSVAIHLITEDENLTEAVRVILQGVYEVRASKAYRQEEAEERPPGCVVVDLSEPGGVGLQGLTEIIAGSSKPVLAILEKSDIQTRREVMTSGIYDFIDVPLDPDRVLLSVRRAIGYRKRNKPEREV